MSNDIIFKLDIDIAKTASYPSEYNSGAYRVRVDHITATKTVDSKYTVSVVFTRLDNKDQIRIERNFIEESPYNKPELTYDIIHDMLSILGIDNTREMLLDKNFNIDDFKKAIQVAIGVELIILVHTEFKVVNDAKNVRSRLRLAAYTNGQTYDEKKYGIETRGELMYVAERMMPMTSSSYLERFGERATEDKDLTLLTKEFGEYIKHK